MSIYDVNEIEKEIERIASENEGEVPEDKLRELVEAQTKSMISIEKICRYIRHLELFEQTAKDEVKRIQTLQKSAASRLESVKKFLTPYVRERGKFDAGTFKLSIKKSEKVVVDDGFEDQRYLNIKTVITPDKITIKKDLKSGVSIPGARIETIDNLQVK